MISIDVSIWLSNELREINSLTEYSMADMLGDIGYKDVAYINDRRDDDFTDEDKKGYLKAKNLLKQMNWNIHEDLLKINKDLKYLYNNK
jgi:hypothetical protein